MGRKREKLKKKKRKKAQDIQKKSAFAESLGFPPDNREEKKKSRQGEKEEGEGVISACEY